MGERCISIFGITKNRSTRSQIQKKSKEKPVVTGKSWALRAHTDVVTKDLDGDGGGGAGGAGIY